MSLNHFYTCIRAYYIKRLAAFIHGNDATVCNEVSNVVVNANTRGVRTVICSPWLSEREGKGGVKCVQCMKIQSKREEMTCIQCMVILPTGTSEPANL